MYDVRNRYMRTCAIDVGNIRKHAEGLAPVPARGDVVRKSPRLMECYESCVPCDVLAEELKGCQRVYTREFQGSAVPGGRGGQLVR